MDGEWEGGERHGVAWRRLLVVLAVLAAVAAAWVGLRADGGMTVETDRNPVAEVSDEPDVVLQPPVRAGARWLCPDDHPVRAYAPDLYYPPEHPSVPPDISRPHGCFISGEWAESAGYELAPPPPDAVRLASLYLVPAVAPSFEACGAVAEVVDFAVPCPEVLPAPGRAMSCASSCLFYGTAAEPGVVIEQQSFLLPAQWCDGCADHVVVAAVRDRGPRELISCGPDMAAAAAAGEDISGYHDCPPGPEWLVGIAGFPHERHTLLVWEEDLQGQITYAVSMEGHGAEIRALVSAIRRGIRYVEAPAR